MAISSEKKPKKFYRSPWFITIAAVVILIIAYFIFHRPKSTYQFIPVTRGSITETVSVTGNTKPVESVSLGFQNSGTISQVSYNVGQHVSPGTVIASLNVSDLSAQLKQAQANVDTQKAKLTGLSAGAQPEDIAVSQASVSKAEQDLANMYGSISDASVSAYSSANDAVRTQLNAFFQSADFDPELTFQSYDSQSASDSQIARRGVTAVLSSWQTELASVSSTSSSSVLASMATDDISNLKKVQELLGLVSTTLNASIGLTASQQSTYKANVTVATNEVNSAMSSINTIVQNIASENLTVAQLKAQLALKQAGATKSDIAAQEAQVESAQAAVSSVMAKLQSSEIIAPMSGVITQQDAKIGQVASPGTPLVSIISDGRFEVEAGVPEVDIGKMSVGDSVSMTFDAFQNETFSGKVFYIDPAETITQGVVDYKVKISFDKADVRMKSGLTANLSIQTKKDDNALILPQYAILVNDQGAFVETVDAKNVVVKNPVKLGIQDESGNVEILSGVTEGEQVLNIGLKPAA